MAKLIAIYLRLSLEDTDVSTNTQKEESNSVGNQRLLIRNYIANQSEFKDVPVVEFCDDGFTGTNFERPHFQTMIELVKDGEIDCIIVKDLSRFGRNYLEVGDYLEHIFPFLGVRFIAINDNYDSDDYNGTTSGLDIAFRNFLHQKYSQDLSNKVRSAMRMKMEKGKYVNHAPFGYMKSIKDKHVLTPDPETAPIVREIFDLAIAGHSTTQIAAILNSRRVPTPVYYKQWKQRKDADEHLRIWEHRTILRIIQNRKYTGVSINHTCENVNIRDRNQKRLPPSQWIVRENMHPAIVSPEEFELAGKTIGKMSATQKKIPDGADRVYYCGHCGRKLRKSVNYNSYFTCDTTIYHPEESCPPFRLEQKALEQILLEAYKGQLQLMDEQLKRMTPKKNKATTPNVDQQLRTLHKTIEKCNSEKLAQYEQYRGGQMSKAGFIEAKARLMEQIASLESKKVMLEERRDTEKQAAREDEVTRRAVAELTSAVPQDQEGLRLQMLESISRVIIYSETEIEIQWKFDDLFAKF